MHTCRVAAAGERREYCRTVEQGRTSTVILLATEAFEKVALKQVAQAKNFENRDLRFSIGSIPQIAIFIVDRVLLRSSAFR